MWDRNIICCFAIYKMLPGNSLHLFLLHVVSLCFFFLSSGHQVFQWHYNGQLYRIQKTASRDVFSFLQKLYQKNNLGVGGMTKKR